MPAVELLAAEPKPPKPPMRGADMRGEVMAGERAIEPRGVMLVPCGPIPRFMELPCCMLPPCTGMLVTIRPGLPPSTAVRPAGTSPMAIGERGLRVTGLIGTVGWRVAVVTGGAGARKPAGGFTMTGAAFQP